MSILKRIWAFVNTDVREVFSRKQEPETRSNNPEQIKDFFKEVFKNDPEQAAYAYDIWNETQIEKRIKETNKRLSDNIRSGKAQIENRYYTDVTEVADEGIYGYSTRDEVIQLSSGGFADIERWQKDPKVKSAFNVLISKLFADPLQVVPKGDDPADILCQEYVQTLLDEMEGTLRGYLKDGVKTALSFQNYFGEVIPKFSENPDFEGKRVIKSIMSKRPGLLEFKTDQYDNVLAIHSLINQEEYYSPDRFLIIDFNKQFSNPYGETLYASTRKFWKAKIMVYNDMVIYSNRYSKPIPKVTYDREELAAKAQELANELYAGATIALPEGVQADFIKAGESGQNPFIPILQWLDSQISLGICGVDLSQGSYAADKVIADERSLMVKDLREDLEDIVYEKIVKRWCSHNFDTNTATIKNYPRICFVDPKPALTAEQMTAAFPELIMNGIVSTSKLSDINRIRTFYDFSELKDDDLEEEQEEDETDDNPESDPDDEEQYSFYSYDESITDFPNTGDNKKVSLQNSNYKQFDYAFALNIKENYPEIWKLGGNIRGNEAFNLWTKARKGDYTEVVTEWIHEREAWMARHEKDKLIAGVVAVMKCGGIVTRGEAYMKNLINEEKGKHAN